MARRSRFFSAIAPKIGLPDAATRGSGSAMANETLTEQPNSSAIGDLKTPKDARTAKLTMNDQHTRRSATGVRLNAFLFHDAPEAVVRHRSFETESVNFNTYGPRWPFSASFSKQVARCKSGIMTRFTFHIFEDANCRMAACRQMRHKKPRFGRAGTRTVSSVDAPARAKKGFFQTPRRRNRPNRDLYLIGVGVWARQCRDAPLGLFSQANYCAMMATRARAILSCVVMQEIHNAMHGPKTGW